MNGYTIKEFNGPLLDEMREYKRCNAEGKETDLYAYEVCHPDYDKVGIRVIACQLIGKNWQPGQYCNENCKQVYILDKNLNTGKDKRSTHGAWAWGDPDKADEFLSSRIPRVYNVFEVLDEIADYSTWYNVSGVHDKDMCVSVIAKEAKGESSFMLRKLTPDEFEKYKASAEHDDLNDKLDYTTNALTREYCSRMCGDTELVEWGRLPYFVYYGNNGCMPIGYAILKYADDIEPYRLVVFHHNGGVGALISVYGVDKDKLKAGWTFCGAGNDTAPNTSSRMIKKIASCLLWSGGSDHSMVTTPEKKKYVADEKATDLVRDAVQNMEKIIWQSWETTLAGTAADSEEMLRVTCSAFKNNYGDGTFSDIAGVAVAATTVAAAICHDRKIFDAVMKASTRLAIAEGDYDYIVDSERAWRLPKYFSDYLKKDEYDKQAIWWEERDDDFRFNLISRKTSKSFTLSMAWNNLFGVMELDEDGKITDASIERGKATFEAMRGMSDAILDCIKRVGINKPEKLFSEIAGTVPGLREIIEEAIAMFYDFVQSVGKPYNDSSIGYSTVMAEAKDFSRKDHTKAYINTLDKIIQAVFAQKKLSMAYFPKMVQTDSESGLTTMIFPYKTGIDYEISIDYSSGNGYEIKLFNQDKPVGSNVVDTRKIYETDAHGKKLNTPIDVINKLYGMLSVWIDKLL